MAASPRTPRRPAPAQIDPLTRALARAAKRAPPAAVRKWLQQLRQGEATSGTAARPIAPTVRGGRHA